MSQKTAIVTGGNRGIGKFITEKFINAGYFVVVCARQDNDLNALFGDQVAFYSRDVCDQSTHSDLVKYALNKTGQLDVYINNVGLSEWRPIEEIDEIFFEQLINTNLKSSFWGCKAAVEEMKKKSRGSIINISSLAGKRGSSNNTLYCASKFGMNGLTQALAKEVGSFNIRVNALCPVLIPTEGLIEALKSPYAPANREPEQFISKFASEQAAMKRLPSGQEVAEMCLFLASENASAITGQCINVDCGVFPQ